MTHIIALIVGAAIVAFTSAQSAIYGIGLFIVILGVGLFMAAMPILAAYGAVTLRKQWERGAALQEADERMGREFHNTIKAEVRR